MRGRALDRRLLVGAAVCTLCFVWAGLTVAEGAWVDELANSLTFYKTSYPNSDWGPYFDKAGRLQDGINRGTSTW